MTTRPGPPQKQFPSSLPRWGSSLTRFILASFSALLLATAPTNAAPGDLNDDGVPDLFEGLLPAAGSSVEMPSFSHNPAGGSTFKFRRKDSFLSSGLTASVEWSSDLASWTTIPIGATSTPPVTIQDNGAEPDLIVVTLPNTEADTKFFARLRLGDTTAPVITAPNLTLEATGPDGAAATFTATATDDVSGMITPTFSTASGSIFPLGVTPVNVSATDVAGNIATATFTVTVKDTTAPVLTRPADVTLNTFSMNGAVATFTATATDLVTSTPTLTFSHPSGSTFPLGTTTVNVSATDAANNTSTATFTVTVTFAVPPSGATVVTVGAGGISFEASVGSGSAVSVQTLSVPGASSLIGSSIKVNLADQGVEATVTSQSTAVSFGLISQAQSDSGLGSGGAVITLDPPVVARVVAASTSTTGTSAISGAGLPGTTSPSAAIATLATLPFVANITVVTPSGVSVTIGAVLDNLSAALAGGDTVVLPTALNDAAIAVLVALRSNPGNAELPTAGRALSALFGAYQVPAN